jgi:hypothetical protein
MITRHLNAAGRMNVREVGARDFRVLKDVRCDRLNADVDLDAVGQELERNRRRIASAGGMVENT